MRAVVRIVYAQGPRRGRQMACILECGHWMTRRQRPGRFGVGCVCCLVQEELEKDKAC